MIAITLAVKTISPHAKPSLKAIAPIDAWTVSLRKIWYNKKIISFRLYLFFITLNITSIGLNESPIKIKIKIFLILQMKKLN